MRLGTGNDTVLPSKTFWGFVGNVSRLEWADSRTQKIGSHIDARDAPRVSHQPPSCVL